MRSLHCAVCVRSGCRKIKEDKAVGEKYQRLRITLFILFLQFTTTLHAGILSTVRGVVHDPQHRPIKNAAVELVAAHSSFHLTAKTNEEGGFEFPPAAIGEYVVRVTADGFTATEQNIQLASGSAPILHFALELARVQQTLQVNSSPLGVDPESSTTMTTLGRSLIMQTPGADRANSLAMLTDYVPGAVMVHDQLHMRGGHQVTWAIDGVPIPNTNIASNVGPQFDPKDIDYLEAQRGGYSPAYGDRTYGVFNAVPRTGFERNQEGDLVTTFGTFNQTNVQLNFAGHTEKFAYYASVNGNRSDYGLSTPGPDVLHDRGWGLGGMGTLIYNL